MRGLFAMDDGWATVFVAVGTAGGGAVTWMLSWLSSQRKTTLGEYQEIVERLQKQVDRQAAQIDEQQRAVNRLVGLHADCRAESRELYGTMSLLHQMLRRQVTAMKAAGIPCEEVPDLPPRPERHGEAEVEFIKRTTEQNTAITTAPPTLPPTGGKP